MDRLRAARSCLRLVTPGLTAALALPAAALVSILVHLRLGHEWILVALSLVSLNAQLVVDVSHPGDRIENILGQALRLPTLDSPRERYLAVLDLDLDTRGVKHAVMGQMFADILLDPGVAALIALWTAATVWPGHPASGSRVARAAAAALPARTVAVTLGTPLSAPVSGLLLPPGTAPTNALTTTGALTPVAAAWFLVPVTVTLRRAYRARFIVFRIEAVRTLTLGAELPLAAKGPTCRRTVPPATSLPRSRNIIFTVLPTYALASIFLAVALVTMLSDALVAELSLGAIAISGKLALPFAAGPSAIRSSVLNPGTSAARTLRVTLITPVTALVILVPVHVAALAMLIIVVCHFERTPFLSRRGGDSQVALPSHPYLQGCKGCAMETCQRGCSGGQARHVATMRTMRSSERDPEWSGLDTKEPIA